MNDVTHPNRFISSAGRTRPAAAMILALALSPLGCSVLLDGEEPQCETNTDCGERGFSGAVCQANRCVAPVKLDATPWGCVGKVKWDPPDTSRTVKYRATYRRLFTEGAVVAAPVALCGRLDASCSNPIVAGETDANGQIELDAFYGFDGFAKATAPPSLPDMMSAILVVNPPLFEDLPKDALLPAHLATADELGSVGALLGATLNPEEGHVLTVTTDCTGAFAANVVLTAGTIAPDTVPYYFSGGTPSRTAAETDAEALGGFVNLPPGFVTITATSSTVGKIGVVTVPVIASHITYLPIVPSPLDGGG